MSQMKEQDKTLEMLMKQVNYLPDKGSKAILIKMLTETGKTQ